MMTSIKKWWRNFLRDREGSAIVEYALIAAIFSIIFVMAMTLFRDELIAAVDQVFFRFGYIRDKMP